MDYPLQDDEALLERLAQSDAKAFNEIYRRYWESVFRYAVSKVHTQQIAEDLCQDVFVSLWQRRGAVAIQNLKAYLFQSAKYSILKHIRLQIQDRMHLQFVKGNNDAARETENAANVRGLMQAWEKAVSSLPPKTQEVFRLSSIEDCSNKEIASRLQLSEKAVEYHITKSYKSIRLQLRDFVALLCLLVLIK